MKFFTTATTLVLLAAVFGATEARTARRQPSTKVHQIQPLHRRAEETTETPKVAPVKKTTPGVKSTTKAGTKKAETEPTKKGAATTKGKSTKGATTKVALAKKGAKKTGIKKGSTTKKTTTKSVTGKKTTKAVGTQKTNPKVAHNTKKVVPKKATGTPKKVVTTPPVPKKAPTPPFPKKVVPAPVPKKVVPTPKVPVVPEQPKQPQPPVQPPVVVTPPVVTPPVVTPPKAPEPQPPVVVAPPKAPEPQPPVVVTPPVVTPPVVVAPPKAPEPQPPVVVAPPVVTPPVVTPPVVAPPPVIPPKLPVNDDKNAMNLKVNQCSSAPFRSYLELNSLTASPAPLTVQSPLTLTIDGNFLKPLERGSKLSVFAFMSIFGMETGETQELDMCDEIRLSSGLECPLPAGRHVLKFVVPKDRLKPMSFNVRGTATFNGDTLFCFQTALKIAKS